MAEKKPTPKKPAADSAKKPAAKKAIAKPGNRIKP